MKINIGSSILALTLLLGVDTYAQDPSLVYEQRFINLTGAGAASQTAGWRLFNNLNTIGQAGVNADGSVGSSDGINYNLAISHNVGTTVSFDDNDKGFIYMYEANPALMMAIAGTAIDRDTQEITNIDFVLRDRDNFDYTAHVAVKVNGQWYVNELAYKTTRDIAGFAYNPRSFTWTTDNWIQLIFDPLNIVTLALSADAPGSLPAGDLEDFGFFIIHPGGGSAIIDEVNIFAMESASTWAGFPMESNGYVDTGSFLGPIVVYGDFLFVFGINNFVYMPEMFVSTGGGWAYVFR